MRRIMAVIALLLTAAAPAPKVADEDAPPIAAPYDTTANARAAVDAAFAASRATGRLVLIDFGGNWCPDCRMLAGVLAAPAVKRWTDDGYSMVLVDVGRENRNLDIPARWGVKITAVPTVLVLTPDGKLLNGRELFTLSDARHMSAQAVVDKLASWRTAP